MAKTEEDTPKDTRDDFHIPDAAVPEPAPAPAVVPPAGVPQRRGLKRFCHWVKTHKKASIPLAIVLVIAILAAIPFTRYALAGVVWKQQFRVHVTDSQTGKPVSSATVTLAGKTVNTNGEGDATIKAPVGHKQLAITKKYYRSASQTVLVPILKPKSTLTVQLAATGRQVPVSVINTITQQAVSGATIKTSDTEAKTDKTGKTTLVVPAAKKTISVTIAGTNYNTTTATLQVTTSEVSANTFKITPSGKLYFLSNLSGNVDVVKSNLDGTDRQTVLPGTGKEDKQNTVLLASRDWKYLALLSKRDGGDNAKLFLIDTSTDKLTTMDEGNASFALTGWSNDTFIYQVNRQGLQAWQPKQQAIKSYNATNGKLTTLDETGAQGDSASYAYQSYQAVYAVGTDIVFVENWNQSYSGLVLIGGKQATVNTVKNDGSGKRVVRGFTAATPSGQSSPSATLVSYLYEPGGVYLKFYGDSGNQTYEYENGQVKNIADMSWNDFWQGQATYPTYLVSPSGNQTFWSDSRDGKNTLFVGDADGKNQKQIASLSDYQTYGWYTDNYVLVSKNSSELYILPATGSTSPLKVTDYYKPAVNFRGYGGGYGGL